MSEHLKPRKLYLDKLISFKDTNLIKVITGIRRCGKSSLMKLMIQHLIDHDISSEQIITMNFESLVFSDYTYKELYNYVNSKVTDKKMYLFFDEIQRITDWQLAINSLQVDIDCDIYITGSNAFLLSSELSTYLSGRYVEIKVFPLSFKEFLDFNDYILRFDDKKTNLCSVMDKENNGYSLIDLFRLYTIYGGMPAITQVGIDQEKANAVLEGIYSAVIMRDVLERPRLKEQRNINDPILLRKLVMFLADNIGNTTSTTSICNTLVNEGLMENRKNKPAVQTVQSYIEALNECYIFYNINRFDIKGKEYLKTLGKYYIVDIGIRNYLLGFPSRDSGHILENIVYFELLRRGYTVSIGKINSKEVDFIATKTNEKMYIQVSESIIAEETRDRELAPLIDIKDNYEKIILTLEQGITNEIDGIKIINVLQWLLNYE